MTYLGSALKICLDSSLFTDKIPGPDFANIALDSVLKIYAHADSVLKITPGPSPAVTMLQKVEGHAEHLT